MQIRQTKALKSFTNRLFHLSRPPGFRRGFDLAERNGRFGCIKRKRRIEKKRKSENRRPILKKLCAALLRSFRGQHSEKMKGSARGNWDPREGQQPFSPNP